LWNTVEIATELGGVLKARDKGAVSGDLPPTHRLFSRLVFEKGGVHCQQLEEGDEEGAVEAEVEDDRRWDRGRAKGKDIGGWLENDDIEEC
jgi:hypothetical protein